MKNKILLCSIIALLPISSGYANDASDDFIFTDAPEEQYVNDTEMGLTWDSVEGAEWYMVSYGETSEKDSEDVDFYYDKETDLIELTETVITDLTPGTTYYFVVAAVDSEGETTPYSPELEVTTEASTGDSMFEGDLGIEGIDYDNIYLRSIVVSFNKDLDDSTDATRIFIITDEYIGVELGITSTELVGTNKVKINLSEDLIANSKYKVDAIVVALDGSIIEDGVEGIIEFETPSELLNETEAIEGGLEVDLNTAPTETMDGNIEVTISDKVTVDDATNLPQTGPTEIIIIAIALLLSGIIIMRKKA